MTKPAAGSSRKIVVLASWADSLLNFRGELLAGLVKHGHAVTACAPGSGDAVASGLRSIGVSFESIDLKRTGMNPLSDVATLRSLKTTLRRLDPDTLLSYTVKPVVYGSLAARNTGVSKVYSIITGLGFAFQGETPAQKLANVAVRRMYKKSLRSNDAVFFQNPDDMDLFIEDKLVSPDQAVLINGSGVNLDRFTFRKARTEPLSFLLIARLLKEKGIVEYAEAARILRESHPDVSFRLLGPYDNNPSSIDSARVEEWQQQGLIEYLGQTDDVRPAIAAASVYVLPSYREGTPRSVLEAMAMGRPIVTTDVPGCRETVVDGDNGFLVRPRDAVSLAAAMKRFIKEPGQVAAMGGRSRELAEERYDVHKVNAVIMGKMGA